MSIFNSISVCSPKHAFRVNNSSTSIKHDPTVTTCVSSTSSLHAPPPPPPLTRRQIPLKPVKQSKKNKQIPLSKSPRIAMASTTTAAAPGDVNRDFYSVWALPPEELTPRLKKLMDGLRSEFGGPQFEPHVTVVGAISLTESEAREKFNKACEVLKAYDARVEKVATGTFYYQCVFLLLHSTPEVVEASAHRCGHFGYNSSTPYMPHLSLLYGDLTDEEKKAAQGKAYVLDDSIDGLNFQISRLALYKTNTGDKSCESWEKVAECQLKP